MQLRYPFRAQPKRQHYRNTPARKTHLHLRPPGPVVGFQVLQEDRFPVTADLCGLGRVPSVLGERPAVSQKTIDYRCCHRERVGCGGKRRVRTGTRGTRGDKPGINAHRRSNVKRLKRYAHDNRPHVVSSGRPVCLCLCQLSVFHGSCRPGQPRERVPAATNQRQLYHQKHQPAQKSSRATQDTSNSTRNIQRRTKDIGARLTVNTTRRQRTRTESRLDRVCSAQHLGT